jgi:hypothetical protein
MPTFCIAFYESYLSARGSLSFFAFYTFYLKLETLKTLFNPARNCNALQHLKNHLKLTLPAVFFIRRRKIKRKPCSLLLRQKWFLIPSSEYPCTLPLSYSFFSLCTVGTRYPILAAGRGGVEPNPTKIPWSWYDVFTLFIRLGTFTLGSQIYN